MKLVLEPETQLAAVVGVVERVGVELQSTALGEEDDARTVDLIVAGRTEQVLAALDRLSRTAGVRSASLSG